MKTYILALSVLMTLSTVSYAGENVYHKKSNQQPSSNSTSLSHASAQASSHATANATGGSVKSTIENDVRNTNKQSQSQGQTQSTDNTNNASQAVTVDASHTEKFPVSSAYAPSMSPSSICMGVASGGAQGVGFGLSLGKSYESKQCNQRELARMFAQMGRMDSAMEVLCSIEGSESVSDCKLFKKTTSVDKNESVGLNEQSTILSVMGK